MINPAHLRDLIVLPVLRVLDAASDIPAATELLMGTAMQESQCGAALAQGGGGPALGVWQMEPATERDLWANYIGFRVPLMQRVASFLMPHAASAPIDRTSQLAGNLYYAAAMARVQYMRVAAPLPAAGDTEAQAAYYVEHYNAGGKATVAEYLANWTALTQALA